MKLTVGKAYEGASNEFKLEDDIHEFQIVNIETTAGRVNMTLVTSKRKRAFKTFFLREKDGSESERGYRELADFITTALQIEDQEVVVDIDTALGSYIMCSVRNSSYEDPNGTKKSVMYINRPERLDCFSDGTESLLSEFGRKRKGRVVEQPVEEEVEDVEEEAVEESEVEEVVDPIDDETFNAIENRFNGLI